MSSRFLSKLPAEIRDQIYDLVFERDYGDYVILGESYYVDPWPGPAWTPRHRMSLLRVNHQIAQEAESRFYNKIEIFGDIHYFDSFLQNIGARRRRLITTIGVRFLSLCDPHLESRLFSLVETMQKLKVLSISVPCADRHEFEKRQRLLLETGLKHFLGKYDISVYDLVAREKHPARRFSTTDIWGCAKGGTDWKFREACRKDYARINRLVRSPKCHRIPEPLY